MKKMRKLLPAIAMLLVSAVMMSTASFAWFTMNSEVTATGMQVTAIAPASLWISPDNTAWSSTMTLGNENALAGTEFNPATPNEKPTELATPWSFYELTSDASQLVPTSGQLTLVNGTGENDGKKVVKVGDTEIVAYQDSDSYYMDTIYLKLDAENGSKSKVYVTASVRHEGVNPDAIYKALRVAIAIEGEPAVELGEFTALDTELTLTELIELTGGMAGTKIVVYAWIEGTDTDCMNANALNKDLFIIDLRFTTKAPTP